MDEVIYVITYDDAGKTAYHGRGYRNKILAEIACQTLNASFFKICDELDAVRCEYLEELNSGYDIFSMSMSNFRKLKATSIESKYRAKIVRAISSVEDRARPYFSSYRREIDELCKLSAATALTIGYHSLPRNFKVVEEIAHDEGLTPCE